VSGNGTLSLSVNGATATVADLAGNTLGLSFAGPTYTIDRISPTVTVNQANGQADPTRTQPLRFAIAFSEAVFGFNSSMISRSGTAGGLAGATIVAANPSADNRTFDVTISGLTGDGTVSLNLAAGVVNDVAGNPSSAATSTDATIVLDTTPPSASTPDLDPASDSGSNSADNITFDTTPTFAGTATDGATIQLRVGTTVLGSTTATGGTWSIASPVLADGVYNVVARATDVAGNSSDSASLAVTIDTAGPTAAVTRAAGQAAAVVATAPNLTVQFAVVYSQPLAALTASDLTLGGTAGGTILAVAGSGSNYTVTLGGFARPGTVTVGVKAGVGSDAAGNLGLASPQSEPVTVNFATQTAVQVSPTALVTGDSTTVTATVSAPAGGTPPGSVQFTLTGPNGTTQRTIALSSGTAATTYTSLAGGNYTVTAAYVPASGFVTSNASRTFTVNGPVVVIPVDENEVGPYAGAAGTTVTVFDASGAVIRSFAPFDASEAPGGVRAAVADVNGDGTPDVVAVTGPGSPATLRAFDGQTNLILYSVSIFEGFTGGAFVAAGDLNGDGTADLAVTPDQGGGPRVTILNGPNGVALANFFAIEDPNFRGGARASIGDLTADGRPDLVVSAGFGGGPRVAGYDGTTLFNGVQPTHIFHDFFLFEEGLRNGAYVTIGDLNGDGFGDIIGGGGPGGAPRVLAYSGKALVTANDYVPLANFFAGDVGLRGGVRVVAKDQDGDGKADLVTGSGDTADLFVFFGSDLIGGDTAPRRTVQLPGILDGIYVG